MNTEEKTAEALEQERIPAESAAQPKELSDEEIDAIIEKRLGAKPADLVKKSEQVVVLTEDQKRELEQKRQSEALTFGLEKNIISKSDYDEFLKATATDPVELARKKFIDQHKELTPEEATKQFNIIARIDEDDDLIDVEGEAARPNEAKKIAQGWIKKLAEEELETKFASKIKALPTRYEEHKAQLALQKSNGELITKAIKEIPQRLEVKYGENAYGIDISPEDITEAHNLVVEGVLGKKDLTPEEIKETAAIFIKAKNFDRLLEEGIRVAVEKSKSEYERGEKGLKQKVEIPIQNNDARGFLEKRGIEV